MDHLRRGLRTGDKRERRRSVDGISSKGGLRRGIKREKDRLGWGTVLKGSGEYGGCPQGEVMERLATGQARWHRKGKRQREKDDGMGKEIGRRWKRKGREEKRKASRRGVVRSVVRKWESHDEEGGRGKSTSSWGVYHLLLVSWIPGKKGDSTQHRSPQQEKKMI